jgi:hypothetical protein
MLGHCRVRRVGIEADNTACGPDALDQQIENASRPTAEVYRIRPRPQPNPIEQGGTIDRQFVSLALESSAFGGILARMWNLESALP